MSALMMESHNPWENSDEVPSKLNKFKRLLARHHQEQQQDQCDTKIDNTPTVDNSSDIQSNAHNGNVTHYFNGNPCNEPQSSQRDISNNLYCDTRPHDEAIDMPLNLSVPSSRVHTSANHHHQPSVIPPHWGFQTSSTPSPPLVMDVDDSDCVDEHFQRSLGSIYTRLQDRGSPSSPRHAPSSSAAVRYSPGAIVHDKYSSDRAHSVPDTQGRATVNNSVDEHFSKSLGDLWTRVKGVESPSRVPKDSATSNSVDDHFAKALGDTWYQIKSSGNQSPASYHAQSTSSPQRFRDFPH